ncbi:hypothetical protein RIF29_41545 [Crotalaria pallida]|uniref:Uncharacterized protein n=1 Tax=Crotalaria pallida TaxID=3830 RepID=A0AAN9HPG8_CROPI
MFYILYCHLCWENILAFKRIDSGYMIFSSELVGFDRFIRAKRDLARVTSAPFRRTRTLELPFFVFALSHTLSLYLR